MGEIFNIEDKLPEKGTDIIGYDPNGDKHYCFRCNCHNINCMEWRCQITGGGLLIKVVKWEYDHGQ